MNETKSNANANANGDFYLAVPITPIFVHKHSDSPLRLGGVLDLNE